MQCQELVSNAHFYNKLEESANFKTLFFAFFSSFWRLKLILRNAAALDFA
jgi:hypothetical protein